MHREPRRRKKEEEGTKTASQRGALATSNKKVCSEAPRDVIRSREMAGRFSGLSVYFASFPSNSRKIRSNIRPTITNLGRGFSSTREDASKQAGLCFVASPIFATSLSPPVLRRAVKTATRRRRRTQRCAMRCLPFLPSYRSSHLRTILRFREIRGGERERERERVERMKGPK